LVDIHRGNNNTGIWSLPPHEFNDFLNPGGILISLSLPDIGFLDLIQLRRLAFLKARTLLRALSNIFSVISDSAGRDFGPPQLNCMPVVIGFEVFS
jgi:hypothetical protein